MCKYLPETDFFFFVNFAENKVFNLLFFKINKIKFYDAILIFNNLYFFICIYIGSALYNLKINYTYFFIYNIYRKIYYDNNF